MNILFVVLVVKSYPGIIAPRLSSNWYWYVGVPPVALAVIVAPPLEQVSTSVMAAEATTGVGSVMVCVMVIEHELSKASLTTMV